MSNLEQLLVTTKTAMEQTVAAWHKTMDKIRTGKASNALLDGVMINYYGTTTPLLQLAQVTVPEPNQILVRPYDRTQMSDFISGINRANLGISPVADAEVIRLVIPPLTEQVRKEAVKKMWKDLENFRVHLRNERRDFLDKVRKNPDFNEDLVKKAEKDVQDLINQYVKILDTETKKKEKELMTL